MTLEQAGKDWNFPEEMKLTIRRRSGRIHDVLYNGRSLPPFAQDSLRVDFPDGVVNVTMTFIALQVVVEDDAVMEGVE